VSSCAWVKPATARRNALGACSTSAIHFWRFSGVTSGSSLNLPIGYWKSAIVVPPFTYENRGPLK